MDEPGWLFTPSTIGNQVWDVVNGERVVDGSVLYPIRYTATDVTVVVGHTGCGAVSAALSAVKNMDTDHPPGIRKWITLLQSVIKDAMDADRVRRTGPSLVDQLVEINVDRQVQFLRECDDIPSDEQIFGFVYDFQGVYGDRRGLAYLINANGETDVHAIRATLPPTLADHVQRLT